MPVATGQASGATVALGRCPLCGENHDEVVALLWQAVIRRISDPDLAAEILYVERELLDDPPVGQSLLRHRLTALRTEERRRRRIAIKGGPLYLGQSSVGPERIAAVKKVDVADLIARDLSISRVRGERTWFHCLAHGGADSDPSLVAYGDQGRWWCFGCNSGGDVIDWMMVRHGLEFRQAVEELERWP
jgi:hypothetical protein